LGDIATKSKSSSSAIFSASDIGITSCSFVSSLTSRTSFALICLFLGNCFTIITPPKIA